MAGKFFSKEETYFVNDIIKFYDSFLLSIANAIKDLSKIQKEHKKGYENLKEVQINPEKLLNKFKEMDINKKSRLLTFFMEASQFETRLMNLFKLTPKEQEILAEDIKTFLNKSKEIINEDD